MSMLYEERSSDSPYIEMITRGWTARDGSTIRPAEINWHMVFVRHNGRVQPVFVGPLRTAGVASWEEGAELLWIRFKLGTFMPHLPTRDFLDVETNLPGAASQSFWLKGSAWQFPDYDNADTFVARLARDDLLTHDPLIDAVLQGQPQAMSLRTIQRRFLRATGLTPRTFQQIERARQAMTLLQQGVPILDTVYETGYFDQSHLTNALKRFVGQTPAQISHLTPGE